MDKPDQAWKIFLFFKDHGAKIENSRAAMDLIEDALLASRDEALKPLQKIVDEQAEDEGLWFVARYASEEYLQQELRRLHAAIEALKTEPGGKL